MKRTVIAVALAFFTVSLFAQVKNPDKPLKGKWDFQMKKCWETDSAGEHIIARVQNLASGKDGRVYALDKKTYKVFIFGKDGNFISAFGKKGEGPGEIRRLYGGDQLHVVDKHIIISDVTLVHYFTLDGVYEKSAKYPLNLTPRAFPSGDVFISAPTVISFGAKGEVTLFDVNKKSKSPIDQYTIFNKATDSRGGQRRRSIVIENITPMMSVTARNGKVYYGMTTEYNIKVAGLDGKKVTSFSIDGRKREKVSKVFLDYVRKQLENSRPETIKRIFDALPKEASFFWKLSVDKNGLIYVYISDPNRMNYQAFDIFSPKGKFLYSGEIKIEDEHIINIISLEDDVLLVFSEDDEGEIKITKYSVKLPSAK